MKKLAIISTIILGLAATSCNNYIEVGAGKSGETAQHHDAGCRDGYCCHLR